MMFNSKRLTACSGILLGLIAGCGLLNSMPSSHLAAADASALIGSWQGDCIKTETTRTDPNSVSQSTQQALTTFTTDNVVRVVVNTYHKAACQNLDYITTIQSHYAPNGNSSAVPGAWNIDYVLDSIVVQYKDHTAVDELNDIEFCGYSNWDDKPKDITGRKCFEDDPALPAKGAAIFDIVKVDGDKIAFGLSSLRDGKPKDPAYDGSSPDKRPLNLDANQSQKKLP